MAQRLADRVCPADLVHTVRRLDTTALVQGADLNAEQAEKVVATLVNSPLLFDLETVELLDQPRIERKDGADYKDSLSLSTGQKCTAILPILLLDSDNPLIVDQPEDNLDNRFIFEAVVDSIRKVAASWADRRDLARSAAESLSDQPAIGGQHPPER